MENSEIVISIIIPVYKVEKYINQCIDSILCQEFEKIEVILVDDGSPDMCPRICDQYARRDKRVRVIHKKNEGLSEARNIGVKKAIGKYILFVDSDDYWLGNFLGELYNLSQQLGDEYDFINFNYCYFYQRLGIMKKQIVYPVDVISASYPNEIIPALAKSGLFPVGAWMKLIKRDFLVRNNIKFIKGITSEDIPWFIEILTKCRKCKFINDYYYVYRKQIAGSISSSFSKEKYESLFYIVNYYIEKIDKEYNGQVRNDLLSFLAYEYCILWAMVNGFPLQERNQQIKRLSQYLWLLKYDSNPKVKKVRLLFKFAGQYISRYMLSTYIKKVVNKQ